MRSPFFLPEELAFLCYVILRIQQTGQVVEISLILREESHMRIFHLAALLAVLAAHPVQAQVASQLQEGVRVRLVKNNGKATVGFLSAQTPDSLSIVRARSAASAQTFALKDLSHVDVSRGRSRAKGAALKGLMGLGVGAIAGGLIGAATYSEGDGCQPDANNWCLFDCFIVCSRGEAAAFAGVLGGGAGLLIGTAIGIATGWERWESVPARTR